MRRRPRVFISAVTGELGKHRSRLALELRRRGVEVIVQDDFRQVSGTLLDKLRAVINRCDTIICLIGRSYGAEPPSPSTGSKERHSFTQWEFLFALDRHRREGTPLFVYLLSDDNVVQTPPQSDEEARLQQEFIQFVIGTGLDREPIESEDKLAIRVLQHPWEGAPGVAWKITLSVVVLILLLGSFLVYLAANQDFKKVDRMHESQRRRIEAVVADHLQHEQSVVSTPDATQKSAEFLPLPADSGFTCLRKELVWDARRWRLVTTNAIGSDGSALTCHTRLELRKDRSVNTLVQCNKTSGTALFSRNHSPYQWNVFAMEKPKLVGDILMSEWQHHFDVSSVPVGGEFTINYESTYWNSIQSKGDLWVGLTATDGLRDASILLILPEGKRWKRYWATIAANEQHVKMEPVNYGEPNHYFIADEANHQWIYWEAIAPKPGHVYQLRWEW